MFGLSVSRVGNRGHITSLDGKAKLALSVNEAFDQQLLIELEQCRRGSFC